MFITVYPCLSCTVVFLVDLLFLGHMPHCTVDMHLIQSNTVIQQVAGPTIMTLNHNNPEGSKPSLLTPLLTCTGFAYAHILSRAKLTLACTTLILRFRTWLTKMHLGSDIISG